MSFSRDYRALDPTELLITIYKNGFLGTYRTNFGVQLKSFQNTLSSTFFGGVRFEGFNLAASRGKLFPFAQLLKP